MNFTRLVKYGAIGLTGILALTGCSAGQAQEEIKLVTEVSEPVTLDFWHALSGYNGEVLNEIVEDFNETVGEEKGITVVPTFQGSYSDNKSKVMASLKAGNAPDIVMGTNNDIYEYVSNGFAMNLDEYIYNGEIGMYGEEYSLEDIYSVFREDSKSYTENGDYYSLPFSKSTDLLFYNKTFFEEHGLKVPQTWEEVVEVSKQITEITKKASFSIDNTSNHFITMMKQLGGEYTNKDGEVLFNNETGKYVLELTRENIENGNWRTAGEDIYSSTAFTNGLVQMYVGSSAGASFLENDNFEWAAVPSPQWDLENPHYISQGNNVAVIKSSTSTSDEVYGSYEFIKYLVGHEANLKWSTETGYLPVRKSVSESEEYQTIMNEDSSKQAAVSSVENGFIEALFANGSLSSNIVRTQVGVMVDEVISTDVDIQDLLDQTEYRLNSY